MLIFICNFTPVVHEHYRIGVPLNLYYKEILNSDSEIYGGSNVGIVVDYKLKPFLDGHKYSIPLEYHHLEVGI